MSRSGSRSVGSGFAGSRSRNGCVTKYWCEIGSTGMRTPASRPTSAENMPAAITTTSQSMSPRSVRTRRTRPPELSIPTTRVEVKMRAPPCRARSASSNVSCEGSRYPSVGRSAAPSTPSVDISGNSSCASEAEISSSGSPNVLAQPAWRRSSSIRSSLDASLMPPHSTQPGIVRYSSTEYIIILVSETEPRSWPTSPAEWKVEPEVSWFRSTSTTSSHPSCARWWAIDVPPTPPPTITQRAASGSSRRAATRPLEPAAEALVLGRLRHSLEVLVRVRVEVEVELGDARLDHAPHRLAEVRHEAEQLQRRPLARVCLLAEVSGQEALLVRVAELVVHSEVAEVEERVAHPGVLPVDDHHALAVVQEVRREQVVVAREGLVVGVLAHRLHHLPRVVACVLEALRQRAAAALRDLRVVAHDLGDVEVGRQFEARVVEAAQRLADLVDVARLAQLGGGHLPALDEARHEAGPLGP